MFEKHKKVIDKKIKRAMVKISNHIAEKLINESPIWTGEYIKNMVVSTQMATYPRSKFQTPSPYPPKIDGTSIMLSEKQKLKAIAKALINSGSTRIVFQNSAGHAHFVEHIGWVINEKTKPPRAVFAKATQSTQLNKKSIVRTP